MKKLRDLFFLGIILPCFWLTLLLGIGAQESLKAILKFDVYALLGPLAVNGARQTLDGRRKWVYFGVSSVMSVTVDDMAINNHGGLFLNV